MESGFSGDEFDWDVSYDESQHAVVISVAADGIALEVQTIMNNGGDENDEDWKYMKDNMIEMSDSFLELAQQMGPSRPSSMWPGRSRGGRSGSRLTISSKTCC